MLSNYLICATARSGSNWLCELLSSLGFAGRPFEHLWDPQDVEPEPLGTRWPRVLQAGTGDNGVFGTKLLWYQAERLESELPTLLGRPNEPLGRVLAITLADPTYIYLTRRDHLRQAISFVRAMQTRQWRSTDAVSGEPRYDAQAITDAMQFLAQEEVSWEGFFARHAISPYRLSYEELDASPDDAVAALLRHLGYEESAPIALPTSQHRRQADEISEEWARRYVREQATR